MYHNLRKTRQHWGVILKVRTNTGSIVWSRGMLYKTVSQTVILYGSDSWLVTGVIFKVLEGFHNREAWQIVGMTDRRAEDGEWEYPPVDYLTEAVSLWSIKEYIKIRQSTIAA